MEIMLYILYINNMYIFFLGLEGVGFNCFDIQGFVGGLIYIQL